MSKILVADDLASEGLELLRSAGEVVFKKGLDEAALRAELANCDALVVRSATQVTARSLELADRLALIGRAGIGVDNIDVAAATARGIVVMNTPEAGAVTTGEHAMALLLSLARCIPAADASVREGKWEKSKFTGVELLGKQLGVLGLGRIGRVVAERARGFQMTLAAYDPFVPQDQAPDGIRMLDLDELLASSDFVTVHVPLGPETQHLLDSKRLRAMKPGARLICAARGGIVDEAALVACLNDGHLAGAALDVFESEPLPADSPLRSCKNLVLTPHLGASTHEAKRNVSIEMAKQVVMALQKGVVLNGVNVPRLAPADAAQVGPYLDLARNLAALLVQLFPGTLDNLRLTVQGALPRSAHRSLEVAMLLGALRGTASGPLTPVNVAQVARDRNLGFCVETATLKRDFQILLRVEATLSGVRHFASGTVLGNRHGRLIELDDFVLDAIPEGPMLVTLHDDRPGVVGFLGTVLGEAKVNISRMQIGSSSLRKPEGTSTAIGVLNLSAAPSAEVLQRISAHQAIQLARVIH